MNTQVLQGQWNQVRGQLKQKWSQLTDDDLRFASGNVDQLVGRIQHKTGEAREAIEGYLDELTAQGGAAISQAADTAGRFVRQAADSAREGYHRLSEQVGQGYNRMSDQLGHQFESSRELIRDNPARSVATAFGVGLLVGVVVGLAVRSR
jgi:uncharacterized protein YjbJ (UPF0337 family)